MPPEPGLLSVEEEKAAAFDARRERTLRVEAREVYPRVQGIRIPPADFHLPADERSEAKAFAGELLPALASYTARIKVCRRRTQLKSLWVDSQLSTAPAKLRPFSSADRVCHWVGVSEEMLNRQKR